MPFDPFDRPIPGESLTQPMQDDAIYKPPQINNLDEAFFNTVETIEDSESLFSDLLSMIDAGVDLESIANVVTFGSFSKGVYSPDIAMQLTPLLMIWMYVKAHENNIEIDGINIMNFPKNKSKGNMSSDDIVTLMKRKNPEKFKKQQKEAAVTELDDFLKQVQGGASQEEQVAPSSSEPMSFMEMQPNSLENV
jgi:hypothetical protein